MNGSDLRGIISTTDSGAMGGQTVHGRLADLPAAALALFADPAEDLFASRLWFNLLTEHAWPEGWTPRFVSCGAPGEPAALLPLVNAGRSRRTLQSMTGPYSLSFRPLLAPGCSPATGGRLLGQFCRHAGVVRLEALSAERPGLDEFEFGLRRAGLAVIRYDHFGNWYEPVAGVSFAAFLAARSALLRNTIRRKLRRALAQGEFAIVTGGAGLAGAIETYEKIYARSWKEPEPFPSFHSALMRAVSAEGLLRLGILRLSGQAAAVQLWVVFGERAVLLKLAHDEEFAAFSPGTVLTALMIERLLAEKFVTELDFGRGDDAYKRLWTTQRRQRIGLMLANPLRPQGMTEIGRWLLGSGRRKVVARMRHMQSSRNGSAEPETRTGSPRREREQ